jgi:hypothetical protein
MELQEQYNQLVAAKQALDVMYGDCIRQSHQAKTDLILKEQEVALKEKAINDLIEQNNKLLKDIEELKQLNEPSIEL